jgi:hypothetical protein
VNGRGVLEVELLDVVETLVLLVDVPVGAVVLLVGAVVVLVDDGEVVEEDTTFEFTV